METGKPGRLAQEKNFNQDFSASEGLAKQVGTAVS